MGFRRLSRRLIGGVVLFATLGIMPGWFTPAWAGVEFAPVLRVASPSPFGGTVGQLAGPVFFYEQRSSRLEWGVRPLTSSFRDDESGTSESDLLYPLLSIRTGPNGQHGQLLQLVRWSTPTNQSTENEWMIFPLVAYQYPTSQLPGGFALFPLYGSLHRFLGQDRLQFTLFPLWLTLERNQIRRNFVLWPFFGWSTAASDTAPTAHGWRFWPFYGELIQEGIKEDRFVLWPFFVRQRYNLNTDEPLERTFLFPFYYASRSPDESGVWWLWPFSFGRVVNTKTHYEEWDLPWPLIQFGSGDEKRIRRVFPFYSKVNRTRTVNLLGTNEKVQASSTIMLWPLYRASSEIGPDWRRDRTLLLLLYSDVRTQKAKAPEVGRRIDLWPLFTYNKMPDGVVRFQTLALIEAFLNTEPITRNYSPLWSLATYNRNANAAEFSLLWGLFRWTATEREQRLRFFFLPSVHWMRGTQTTPPPSDTAPAPPAPIDPAGSPGLPDLIDPPAPPAPIEATP